MTSIPLSRPLSFWRLNKSEDSQSVPVIRQISKVPVIESAFYYGPSWLYHCQCGQRQSVPVGQIDDDARIADAICIELYSGNSDRKRQIEHTIVYKQARHIRK